MHLINPQNQKSFMLKGSMFTLSMLQLLSTDINLFKQQFAELDSTSLTFFKNAPMVLDLQQLPQDAEINFAEICSTLRTYNIFPVGIIGGSETQQTAAMNCNLGLINHLRSASKNKDIVPSNQNTTTIITRHIRSGQQIHAKDGDLVIINSVSAGAEVLANGNIHIYGTLNGKALAGLNGDKTSRIFCSSLNAELLSIAGIYKLSEDMPLKSSLPTQIFLENNQLKIQNL